MSCPIQLIQIEKKKRKRKGRGILLPLSCVFLKGALD